LRGGGGESIEGIRINACWMREIRLEHDVVDARHARRRRKMTPASAWNKLAIWSYLPACTNSTPSRSPYHHARADERTRTERLLEDRQRLTDSGVRSDCSENEARLLIYHVPQLVGSTRPIPV